VRVLVVGPGGRELLERVALPAAMRAKTNSALRLIDAITFEIDTFAGLVTTPLHADPGYAAVQTIPGVGPTLGAVFVAEIGDVRRFRRPEQLASWAGLTPKHRESDTKVRRGRITKMGSKLVRWAALEAVQRVGPQTRIGAFRDQVAERRGRNQPRDISHPSRQRLGKAGQHVRLAAETADAGHGGRPERRQSGRVLAARSDACRAPERRRRRLRGRAGLRARGLQLQSAGEHVDA